MKIDLNLEEEGLLSDLELDQDKVRDHSQWLVNSEIAARLSRSLVKRGAIGEHRWKWFNDAAYNPGGRGKSRKDQFLANTKTVDEMIRHNNFLPHLRYFIFGPDLPARVVQAFFDRVADCGHVTSSDIVPLGKYARELVRTHRLDKSLAPDEFYKLALEAGIWHPYADSIRDSVKQVR